MTVHPVLLVIIVLKAQVFQKDALLDIIVLRHLETLNHVLLAHSITVVEFTMLKTVLPVLQDGKLHSECILQ